MNAPDELTRFTTLLDTFGADRSRWPARDRAFADGVLARSQDAQHAFEQARALDALLDTALRVPAIDPSALRDRVLTGLGARDRGALWFGWLTRGPWLWRPIALALVPLALGIVAGATLPQGGADDPELIAALQVMVIEAAETYPDAQ
jgi:hypothetical protein